MRTWVRKISAWTILGAGLLFFGANGQTQPRLSFLFNTKPVTAPDSVQQEIKRFRVSVQTARILLKPSQSFLSNLPFAVDLARPTDNERRRLQSVYEKALAAVDGQAFARKNWPRFLGSLQKARQILRPIARFARRYTLYLDGNAHIDMAWLWRWRETVEVCRNTFQQQLNLMNQFPDYVYTQSTAMAFRWMQTRYPNLFHQIQQRVREGRWEMVGGMVVEADCNLIGGESWVRQHLYGKRYFRRAFGVDIHLGWNPDSFGYNWNMPQFLRKSGVRAFLTQKISWNDTNVFPYHLFWWEAPDGSRVLTYFPFSGYVGQLDLNTLLRDIRLSEINTGRRDVLVLYGVGDHGGGPERRMLERVLFYQTATVFPKVVFSPAGNYFKKLFQGDLSGLPVWRNELYLEYHRGTYTTHGEIKRNNREKEILLTNAEKMAVLAGWTGKKVYRQNTLTGAWWTYLFNQFHDILPGSGIRPVYKDALKDYQAIGKKASGQLRAALRALAASIDTRTKGQAVVVFNTLSWARDGLVRIPFVKNPGPVVVRDANGKEIASQWVVSPKDDTLLFVAKQVPPLGFRVYSIRKGTPREVRFAATATGYRLENRFYHIEIDPKTGNIASLVDKRENRNLLAPGEEGNRLQLFQDIPKYYDAWNIGYTGKRWEIDRADTVFVKERGPVRAVIRVKKSFLGPSKSRRYPTKDFPSSFFTQDVTVYRDLPWADCEMTVDWWEDHVLAKAAFPLSVQSQEATYEIPYATIERPTGRSNSWDRARFEDSAQNWADLSGPDYGVSLLNHVKQGYDTPNGHTLRLTLLRSPLSPDPTADRGVNRFRYALYGHAGDWRDGETVLRGYEYNVPLLAVRASSHKGALPPEFSFVQVEPRTVILAALKEAESQDGVIFRFYEWQGKDTRVRVHFFRTPVRITEVNLIEDEQGVVPFSGRTFEFSIGHNAIRSFKVKF